MTEEQKREFEFDVVPILSNDTEKVISMMRNEFFRDEPMNASLGLANEPDSCQKLEQYCLKYIPEGLSLAAVSKFGELLGVCLNTTIRNEDYENNDQIQINNQSPVLAFCKIMTILQLVDKNCNIFLKFPGTRKALDVAILSVSSAHSGKGIATALVLKAREIAEKQNFPLIRVVCSSRFSAKVASRSGFSCIYSLLYEDYVDDRNNQIIKPALPHTCITVYVLQVAKESYRS